MIKPSFARHGDRPRVRRGPAFPGGLCRHGHAETMSVTARDRQGTNAAGKLPPGIWPAQTYQHVEPERISTVLPGT